MFFRRKILFAKLEDAFINLRSTCSSKYHVEYALDIIHGYKSFVDFEYNGTLVTSLIPPQVKKKELADMMFIVFSAKKRELRLSYMQNKKGSDTYLSYRADLLQLYLLRDRPEIVSPTLPTCVFGNPRILSDALLPSVGSYGVFYKDTACNKIEMGYSPASNIKPHSSIGKEQRVVEYVGKLGTTKVNGCMESQGEATLSDFGYALINMTVGTPIYTTTSWFRKVHSYLLKNSEAYSYADFPQPDINIPYEEIDPLYFQESSPTIIVINADLFDHINAEECVNTDPAECVPHREGQ